MIILMGTDLSTILIRAHTAMTVFAVLLHLASVGSTLLGCAGGQIP